MEKNEIWRRTRFGEEFSKGILIPVFILPIVGILLAFGVLLTNKAIPLANIEKIFEFGTILKNSVLSIFINLLPVFCVGIAAGMAKSKKGNAALNAIVLFLRVKKTDISNFRAMSLQVTAKASL